MPTTPAEERQARLAKMQAAQRNAERRRSILVIGIAGALAVMLIGVVAVVIVQSEREKAAVQTLAAGDIDGVEDLGEQTANHTETPVEYAQTPPVGGDHFPTWQNCGFYEEPTVNVGAGVHSLEHGAVWITYDPALPEEQVTVLRELAAQNPFVLATPMADLPTPVVASAWGRQLQLDDAGDERLQAFVIKFLQGDQSPEPGAPCTGGLDA